MYNVPKCDTLVPVWHNHKTVMLPTGCPQVLFFKGDKDFVNSRDHETGNTALHLASRHGHFVSNTHPAPPRTYTH